MFFAAFKPFRPVTLGACACAFLLCAAPSFATETANRQSASIQKEIKMEDKKMQILRHKDMKPVDGPAEYFTGQVTLTPYFLDAEAPGTVSTAHVTFAPGARTAWHTHPRGQTIIITDGKGWVQREGDPIEEVEAGDVVRFAANERHWHGAAADTSMSHIAIQEEQDGSPVTWQEHVSDEDYTK